MEDAAERISLLCPIQTNYSTCDDIKTASARAERRHDGIQLPTTPYSIELWIIAYRRGKSLSERFHPGGPFTFCSRRAPKCNNTMNLQRYDGYDYRLINYPPYRYRISSIPSSNVSRRCHDVDDVGGDLNLDGFNYVRFYMDLDENTYLRT